MKGKGINKNDVDNFERLSGQLIGIYEEISLLSKKAPNDAVNKFKLKFINKLVTDSNQFLSDKYRPFDDFFIFEEDEIPQNSDVVFIVSQYLQSFEKLRSDNIILKGGSWHWKLLGNMGDNTDENGFVYIRTTKPKRLLD
ncbi:hypothetical protein [Nitrosospira multiformis]|uniref:Uncharacterized protein n=1 Tax=Nitrosospira multiformis TaxID=1231 RepID=A0A1I7HKK6_9PROT|nr:hypothetical protein [Nitrosospira multiformis]SFU61089.1 hypothetical protein SAMN05216417_11017 [Nitrosospira multiformis]